jgi:hypothetical protein
MLKYVVFDGRRPQPDVVSAEGYQIDSGGVLTFYRIENAESDHAYTKVFTSYAPGAWKGVNELDENYDPTNR